MVEYVRTTTSFLEMGYAVYVVNQKSANQIIQELSDELRAHQGTLSDEQKKRIRFYTIQSTITTRLFSTLRGTKPNKNEKRLALLVGAITPFLDDLSDHRQISLVDLFDQTLTAASTEELAVRYLFEHIKKLASPDFFSAWKKVLQAQDQSRAQLGPEKQSELDLRKITFFKGGSATLLYRLVLSNPLRSGEARALYLLGYLLQLINDQFDVYKDYHNAQQTLYTNTTDFQIRKREYVDLQTRVIRAFLHLGYDLNCTIQFLSRLFTITSRGDVCAAQLARIPIPDSSTGGIGALPRSDLICDMEKRSNLKKSFSYSVQADRQTISLMNPPRRH